MACLGHTGVYYQCLIDEGAECCIIPGHLLGQLKLALLSGKLPAMNSVGGLEAFQGIAKDVLMSVHGVKHTVTFIVSYRTHLPIILG